MADPTPSELAQQISSVQADVGRLAEIQAALNQKLDALIAGGGFTGDLKARDGKFAGGLDVAGAITVEGGLAASKVSAADGDQLRLESRQIHLAAVDLILDADPAGARRALRNNNDQLILNCGADFKDGVVIGGEVAIEGRLLVAGSASVAGELSASGNATIGGGLYVDDGLTTPSITPSSDDELRLNALTVHIVGTDLVLDADAAQGRRALVNNNDRLILNFNGDFRDAVHVGSDVHINGHLYASGQLRPEGADCAEGFPVRALDEAAPGRVMVIGDDGRLEPCARDGDPRVAGVVSGAGEFRPAILLNDRPGARAPIALMGSVSCWCDADRAPIRAGDLLTTSATLGCAMRAERAVEGAIIGKALQPLERGVGLVAMLVRPS